jgi:TfoX/Sxy family transcriptional regulator of competence genes
MTSSASTIEFILDQAGAAGGLTAKRMFGEFGLFSDGKMVAVICDDQLLVKPTAGGRAYCGPIDEVAPYPGAKPYLLVDGERLEDRAWLSELIRITTFELPTPKPKKPAKPKAAARQA